MAEKASKDKLIELAERAAEAFNPEADTIRQRAAEHILEAPFTGWTRHIGHRKPPYDGRPVRLYEAFAGGFVAALRARAAQEDGR